MNYENLIGKNLKEADKILPSPKYVVPVMVDDKPLFTTTDPNHNRIKVVVKDSLIIEVIGEG